MHVPDVLAGARNKVTLLAPRGRGKRGSPRGRMQGGCRGWNVVCGSSCAGITRSPLKCPRDTNRSVFPRRMYTVTHEEIKQALDRPCPTRPPPVASGQGPGRGDQGEYRGRMPGPLPAGSGAHRWRVKETVKEKYGKGVADLVVAKRTKGVLLWARAGRDSFFLSFFLSFLAVQGLVSCRCSSKM